MELKLYFRDEESEAQEEQCLVLLISLLPLSRPAHGFPYLKHYSRAVCQDESKYKVPLEARNSSQLQSQPDSLLILVYLLVHFLSTKSFMVFRIKKLLHPVL